jgi:hypothetical protein
MPDESLMHCAAENAIRDEVNTEWDWEERSRWGKMPAKMKISRTSACLL